MDTVSSTPDEAADTSKAELRRTFGSHVSRVLGSSGFARASAETTSVRGSYRYSPGFKVRGYNESWEIGLLNNEERDAGHVTVQHQLMNSYDFSRYDQERPLTEHVTEQVAEYAGALESAGFEVEVRARADHDYLVILGRH